MTGTKSIHTFIFSITVSVAFCQDIFSYSNSNYSGIINVISNPATAAGNAYKLDIVLAGFNATFNNSWAGVKREALSFPKLGESWRNYTPNLPGNIYKNFVWHGNERSREVLFEQRVLLPSFLFQPDSKNSFAFICNLRQVGNIRGISSQLANLFEKEFDLSVLQNNPVENKNFSAIRMSWIEYGLTYARKFTLNRSHHLKFGVTPKLLQGLESSYFLLRELNFLFSNKDTLSYFDADFTTAHSARSDDSPLNITGNFSEKIRQAAPMTAGLDVGFVYEWTPAVTSQVSESPPTNKKRPGRNFYKLKAGVSIVDIGRIMFKKQLNYYDMQISLRQHDIIRYISAENMRMVDSLLQNDFPANTGEDNFSVLLPTAMNAQLDYSFTRNFFLGLSSHFTGFNTSEFFKVRNYSSVCLAPRYESYWVDVSLLLSWIELSAQRSQPLVPGLNLRFGPLSIGSSDLTFLFEDNLSSLNFFVMLRLSLPVKENSEVQKNIKTPGKSQKK
jgi:hypothetical protein